MNKNNLGIVTSYRRKTQPINENGVEGINFVTCFVCGEKFFQLNHSHLKKKHGISTEEYKKKFNIISLTSKCYSEGRENTFIIKYGAKNQFGIKQVKEKLNSEDVKKKKKEHHDATCLKKYGTKNTLSLKEVKDKIEKTNMKKFGFKTNLNIPGVLEKSIATTKKKAELRKQTEEYKNNKIKERLRRSIRSSIRRGIKKDKSILKILDFSLDELVEHLKKTIPKEYLWEDYKTQKKLSIDHIIPINAYKYFSYNDLEFKKCWNLRNLRLISIEDNSKKSDKLIMSLVKEYDIFDLLPNELLVEA